MFPLHLNAVHNHQFADESVGLRAIDLFVDFTAVLTAVEGFLAGFSGHHTRCTNFGRRTSRAPRGVVASTGLCTLWSYENDTLFIILCLHTLPLSLACLRRSLPVSPSLVVFLQGSEKCEETKGNDVVAACLTPVSAWIELLKTLRQQRL